MAYNIWKFLKMAAKVWRKGMIQCNVMINYDCPCRCRICGFWRPPWRGEPPMAMGEARAVAARLRPLAPLAMCLVGGEPTLHPDLVDIAGLLSGDHYLDMVTNGSTMTPELARALYQAGLSEIGVSIDYASAALHDGQRGLPGLFDKAVAALGHLAAARAKPEQRVRLITVVMDDNLDQIEPLSAICRKLGIKHNLTVFVPGRGEGAPPADMAEAERLLKSVQSREPALTILPGYLEGFAGRGRGRCRSGECLMAVDPRGRLLRCLDRPEIQAGSLVEEDLGALLAKLRAMALADGCDECWTSCRGVVEPLVFGPGRLRNWRYQLRANWPEPLAGGPGRAPS
jgi:MoaA/NifB/PqqE/SkfB family radical SAM enzyme